MRAPFPRSIRKPGQTVIEYSELPPAPWPQLDGTHLPEGYKLILQVYRADTLEKLPVTRVNGVTAAADGVSLPYAVEAGPRQ